MSTAVDYNIVELLELAGSRARGRRRDCPDCGSQRTVSVDEEKQVFFCHHAGCEFHGGIGTLRGRLGVERGWIPRSDYLRRQKTQWRASEASRRLFHACRARQLELREELRVLGRLELAAHDAGMGERQWEVLSSVYARRPEVERQLEELESWSATRAFRALSGGTHVHHPQMPPHISDERSANLCT